MSVSQMLALMMLQRLVYLCEDVGGLLLHRFAGGSFGDEAREIVLVAMHDGGAHTVAGLDALDGHVFAPVKTGGS